MFILMNKQGKSEGFDSCDRPRNLTQTGFKSSIFQPVWPWDSMDDLLKQYGTSSILRQALCIISKPSVNLNWSNILETLNSGQNRRFFVTCDLEIWWMTLKNNRAPLQYYVKPCASIKAMGEFKLELQSGNAQFGSKSAIFCPILRMTLKNNRASLLCCFKLGASFYCHQWI